MSGDGAGVGGGWLERLIRITGYGLLVAVPVAGIVFLLAAGRLLGLFIMLGVSFYAVRVIWANRALLRRRLITRAGEVSMPLISAFMRVLARVWHVLAIANFTVLKLGRAPCRERVWQSGKGSGVAGT